MQIHSLDSFATGLAAFANSPSMQTLEIKCSLGSREIKDLAVIIANSSILIGLEVSFNEIDLDAAGAFGAAIAHAPALRGINIFLPVSITDACFKAIFDGLKTSATNDHLELKFRSFSATNTLSLADLLATSKSLFSLFLFSNNINDPIAIKIATALTHSQSICHLSLTNNQITDAAVEAFVPLVRRSKTLLLDLSANKLTNVGIKNMLVAIFDQMHASIHTYMGLLTVHMLSPGQVIINLCAMPITVEMRNLLTLSQNMKTQVHNPLLTFSAAATQRGGSLQAPAAVFGRRDGDRAVLLRVARFLNDVNAADVAEAELYAEVAASAKAKYAPR